MTDSDGYAQFHKYNTIDCIQLFRNRENLN